MVVIDLETGKAWENLNKTQAADVVGVTRQTIAAWMQCHTMKTYRGFKIYFYSRPKR